MSASRFADGSGTDSGTLAVAQKEQRDEQKPFILAAAIAQFDENSEL